MTNLLIDVSEHNGVIDFKKMPTYISGIIARCSWGWGEKQIDEQWRVNASQANELNIPLYSYHFCYARNKEEALKEAELALKACKEYNVNIIYYDLEYSDFQGNLTNLELSEIASTFCDYIEEKGYSVGIYANEDWFKNKLTDKVFSRWTIWLANYGVNNGYDNWNGELKYNPFGNVHLHQFTSNAKEGVLKEIDGILSSQLDCSRDYGVLTYFNNYNFIPLEESAYKIGDFVIFNRLYYSSTEKEYTENLLYYSGEITKIIEGAINPYLINDGIGWINKDCII